MKIKIDSELAKDVYNDGLKESVKETSGVISLIPKAIKAALLPLEKWTLNREYNLKETEILLEKKLKNISKEKIISPEPYIAVPTIQALSYSMNSEKLRNMYANLLSKSMNIDTKDEVHPAFVEIIKQMSPTDAKILKKFVNNRPNIPLIDIIERNIENRTYALLLSNLTNIFDYDNITISVSIDNLLRLGLIQIPEGKSISNLSAYETITSSLVFSNFKKTHKLPKGYEIDEIKKVIFITELGYKFSEICIQSL